MGTMRRVGRMERKGTGEAHAWRLVRARRGLDPGAKSVKPFVIVVALWAASLAAAEQNAPQPPHASVEIPELKGGGQTIRVPAGGDPQKALDQAKAGDRIELQARATYQGPFRLKAKEGNEWIVITSSAELPKPGRHVQPSDASAMPKLTSAGDFVVATDPGAHHYRFAGIEFAPKAGSFVSSLIQFGDREALSLIH